MNQFYNLYSMYFLLLSTFSLNVSRDDLRSAVGAALHHSFILLLHLLSVP